MSMRIRAEANPGVPWSDLFGGWREAKKASVILALRDRQWNSATFQVVSTRYRRAIDRFPYHRVASIRDDSILLLRLCSGRAGSVEQQHSPRTNIQAFRQGLPCRGRLASEECNHRLPGFLIWRSLELHQE